MKKIGNLVGVLAACALVAPLVALAGERARVLQNQNVKDVEEVRESWRVLDPITRGNLTVYPVVSTLKLDTAEFLTLDEGLASGAVRITERGQLGGVIYRRRPMHRWPPEPVDERPQFGGASVNELVLINESSRPLVLLAGEVVSGGKQNRIIGADLIVPPKSEPLPLTVFCVEHGRWSAGSGFSSAQVMAHPEVRREAQVAKSQAGVWDSVARSGAALGAPASPTSNYLDVLASPKAQRQLEEVAKSIESDYERELREQVRGRGAVGVVVAVGGELVWSDLFPSAELFHKYWPKLLRSYVLETAGHPGSMKPVPSRKQAEEFLLESHGHVRVSEEAGLYRRTEISASSFQIVALEALGKAQESAILVHYNKMARD